MMTVLLAMVLLKRVLARGLVPFLDWKSWIVGEVGDWVRKEELAVEEVDLGLSLLWNLGGLLRELERSVEEGFRLLV